MTSLKRRFVILMMIFEVISSTSNAGREQNETVPLLSRKRRYLNFPSGASFQLVFCLTYTSIGVGSYFVFGHTAAIAYELPEMPFVKEKMEESTETTTAETPVEDVTKLDHSDFSWSLPEERMDYGLSMQRPHNVFRYKPNTFSKYLLAHYPNRNDPSFRNYDPRSHMMLPIDPKYHEVHRRTRRELYRKIETFLNRINMDGRSCLLKAICEISKATKEKEPFLMEVFKAVFRAKPHNTYQNEDDYDLAANSEHNCTEKYKNCPGSIFNVQLLTRK